MERWRPLSHHKGPDMIGVNHHAGRGPLSPAELAAAFRDGLESRRQVAAIQAPPDLPSPPGGDPVAPLWPLAGLLGHPAGAATPGLGGKAVRLARRAVKKLINPWLDHQTRFNHQLTATLQAQLAEVYRHLQLVTWRLNEVTRGQPPLLHALEGRVNECFYEVSRLRTGDPGAAVEVDAAWAAEETFLQTRMPDPPGRALVLAADGVAPPTLAAFGYSVLTASPADAADLPLQDGSLRLAVALDRGGPDARSVWSADGRPAREALARLLTRHGRAVGSVRDAAATIDADVARLCAPLRVVEVSRADGVVIWAAAV